MMLWTTRKEHGQVPRPKEEPSITQNEAANGALPQGSGSTSTGSDRPEPRARRQRRGMSLEEYIIKTRVHLTD